MNEIVKVIIGIDPGSKITGYSILKIEEKKVIILDYGFLKFKDIEIQSKLLEFYNIVLDKIDKFNIKYISIEKPFLDKNPRSFMILNYFIGIIYLISKMKKLEIFEFAPREIKLAITGYGNADKNQVFITLKLLFPKIENALLLDVSDSIAIGLTGLWKIK